MPYQMPADRLGAVLVPFWSPYPQRGHRDGFCHPQVEHAYLSRGPEGTRENGAIGQKEWMGS